VVGTTLSDDFLEFYDMIRYGIFMCVQKLMAGPA